MRVHPNAQLIERLYTALQRHDADGMAACYRDDRVRFHDIAFEIREKSRLYGMWRMICEGESGIRVTVEHIRADDRIGEARIVDCYDFGRNMERGERGRPVVNHITSRFRFRDGLIVEHVDDCDERAWAEQALGGPLGWIAGRVRLARSMTANRKLDRFLRDHPVPAAADSVRTSVH
jgi:ketosteroid isomerase-like protein